jgi:hypothetical protein
MGVLSTRVLWGYSVRGYYGGTQYEGTMGVLGTRVLWGYPVRGYLSGLCLTPTGGRVIGGGKCRQNSTVETILISR